jgi:hypothetical protein
MIDLINMPRYERAKNSVLEEIHSLRLQLRECELEEQDAVIDKITSLQYFDRLETPSFGWLRTTETFYKKLNLTEDDLNPFYVETKEKSYLKKEAFALITDTAKKILQDGYSDIEKIKQSVIQKYENDSSLECLKRNFKFDIDFDIIDSDEEFNYDTEFERYNNRLLKTEPSIISSDLFSEKEFGEKSKYYASLATILMKRNITHREINSILEFFQGAIDDDVDSVVWQ